MALMRNRQETANSANSSAIPLPAVLLTPAIGWSDRLKALIYIIV
jgi:hypothetical protein